MTLTCIVFALGTIIAHKAEAKRTISASDCSPTTNIRNVEWAPYYTGKLIDSHFHIPSPLDVSPPRPRLGTNVTLAGMDCVLNAEGTTAVFSFFPVFVSYPYQDFIESAIRAKQKFPKRFVPFLMPPGKDDIPPSMRAKKIKPMLRDNKGLFKGYGEIGLYELGERSADDYPPDAPLFQKIYPVARKHKLMIYFHPGENQADNLANALAENPDINFIVHGDQIQPNILDLMDQYSNIYYSVDMLYGDQYLLRADGTKQEFLNGFEDFDTIMAIDLATWKPMIEAYPNRFMWSTDRGDAVWTYNKKVGRTLANYGRAFIARLEPAVQEKFAYKNARRLMRQSGKK